ncbi:hypothetical protein TNCT_557911 [Trichonephila clavata]|uniref:Uncharacterized protein n=1 Tax=Trichonephila clavata TaxID=2740835 RepID=A0A8X6KW04_TRICU|nr:hypothetical protein TNCT_557911 [Trichonephila clavata]
MVHKSRVSLCRDFTIFSHSSKQSKNPDLCRFAFGQKSNAFSPPPSNNKRACRTLSRALRAYQRPISPNRPPIMSDLISLEGIFSIFFALACTLMEP